MRKRLPTMIIVFSAAIAGIAALAHMRLDLTVLCLLVMCIAIVFGR